MNLQKLSIKNITVMLFCFIMMFSFSLGELVDNENIIAGGEPVGVVTGNDEDLITGNLFSVANVREKPSGWTCDSSYSVKKQFTYTTTYMYLGGICPDNSEVRVYGCFDSNCDNIIFDASGYKVNGQSPKFGKLAIGEPGLYKCYPCSTGVDTTDTYNYCKDGTRVGECSDDTGKKCIRLNGVGKIVDDCVECGCSSGSTCITSIETCQLNDVNARCTLGDGREMLPGKYICRNGRDAKCENGILKDLGAFTCENGCAIDNVIMNTPSGCNPEFCNDGTPLGTCSDSKPFYCKSDFGNNVLEKDCNRCGCPSTQACIDNVCTSSSNNVDNTQTTTPTDNTQTQTDCKDVTKECANGDTITTKKCTSTGDLLNTGIECQDIEKCTSTQNEQLCDIASFNGYPECKWNNLACSYEAPTIDTQTGVESCRVGYSYIEKYKSCVLTLYTDGNNDNATITNSTIEEALEKENFPWYRKLWCWFIDLFTF